MTGASRPGEVWLRDDRPRRRRLTREQIVAAAVALLDADGVAGLSMRRLAARLRVAPMSIYEHVAGKEDILDLALDAAFAEIDPGVSSDGDWRATIAHQLTEGRRVMHRHPWMITLVGSRPLLGPATLERSERFYAALHRAGLAGPALVAAVNALFGFLHGFVASELTWRLSVGRHGDSELRRRASELLARHADRLPTLARHARLDDADADAGFQRCVDMILDGIQAQLDDEPTGRG
ncbi:MAG TPA: TetR/AcrR family transcriptional regulator C-terminal domain-containing protein [Natronosporangium sp.]